MSVKISNKDVQYNSVADAYSFNLLKYNQKSIDVYFRQFERNLKGVKLLDLGCGDGYDLSRFKTMGALIYGVDQSQEMVRLNRKRNPEGIIELGHFEEIPFPDKSFDLVVSKWAIQTAYSIDSVYEEIIRVLKPGGKLIYLVCHPTRQFIEKKTERKDYFKKELVRSAFFDGQIIAIEPSHTLDEYLSPLFFNNFNLERFEEGWDAAAEKINNDTYPSYFLIKATLRD